MSTQRRGLGVLQSPFAPAAFESLHFLRFGCWLCALLMLAATLPGTPMRAKGAGMGGIATLMAITAAAVLHQGTRRQTAPKPDHPSS